MRTAVELGSKPCFEGVTSALRFWVMESSTAPRDMRRKSDVITRGQTEGGEGGEDDGKKEWAGGKGAIAPLSATEEKQNWGVNLGRGVEEGGSAVISPAAAAAAAAAAAVVPVAAGPRVHKMPATLADRLLDINKEKEIAKITNALCECGT